MLPPNATSIVQPLDQDIIISMKRRYKKKLAEGYLVCVENNKDTNALKQWDTVAATNSGKSMEGNYFNYNLELLSQSRLQTP